MSRQQSRQRGRKTDAVGHRGTGGIRRYYGGLLSRRPRLCPRLLGHRQGFLRRDSDVEAQGIQVTSLFESPFASRIKSSP